MVAITKAPAPAVATPMGRPNLPWVPPLWTVVGLWWP